MLSLFAEPVAAAIAKAGLYEAERAHVAQLLDTDRMKTQFVASVSHELRTPITSIRGAVSASRRPVTPEQRLELLDVIERQSLRLQSMVEEIFQAAKMEQEGKQDAPPPHRPGRARAAGRARLAGRRAAGRGRGAGQRARSAPIPRRSAASSGT